MRTTNLWTCGALLCLAAAARAGEWQTIPLDQITKDKPGLAAGATNVFHFVIPLAEGNSRQFGSTNLAAKIQFNRVVLEGGKLADVTKDVSVTPATK